MLEQDFDKLWDMAFGKEITEEQSKEWHATLRKYFDMYDSDDEEFVLEHIFDGECESEQFAHIIGIHEKLEKYEAAGGSFPMELPEYVEPDPFLLDAKICSVLDQPISDKEKIAQFCEILEAEDYDLEYIGDNVRSNTFIRIRQLQNLMVVEYAKLRKYIPSSILEEIL